MSRKNVYPLRWQPHPCPSPPERGVVLSMFEQLILLFVLSEITVFFRWKILTIYTSFIKTSCSNTFLCFKNNSTNI